MKPRETCHMGHPMSGDNLLIVGAARTRRCRTCKAAKARVANIRRSLERGPKHTAEQLFWTKITEGPAGCWLWSAAKFPNGYGCCKIGGVQGRAHRFAYESLIGPIPDGLQLDHLCRVRHCVNPWHLDPVPNAVNSRRGSLYHSDDRCSNGHLYDHAVYRGTRLVRTCSECSRPRRRALYAARRDAALLNA